MKVTGTGRGDRYAILTFAARVRCTDWFGVPLLVVGLDALPPALEFTQEGACLRLVSQPVVGHRQHQPVLHRAGFRRRPTPGIRLIEAPDCLLELPRPIPGQSQRRDELAELLRRAGIDRGWP